MIKKLAIYYMQMIYCFCQHLRLVYNTIYDKSMNSVVDGGLSINQDK